MTSRSTSTNISAGASDAQADPYIVASIKQNRKQRTKTLSNTTHPCGRKP